MKRCSSAVFVTPSARAFYRERYPSLPESRFSVISNGYEEGAFSSLVNASTRPVNSDAPIVLLHSGLMEPQDRDPEPFFSALEQLLSRGVIGRDSLKVILRASGSESRYEAQIKSYGLSGVVTLEPHCSYQQALEEMLSADGLLVFQGASCNRQIPGKIYEYIRSRKPILSLVDAQGDTAKLLASLGIDTSARIDDADDIGHALCRFITLLKKGKAPVAGEADVHRYSRHHKASELAELLDSVV